MSRTFIFKQLFDQKSATLSYLLADAKSHQAIFIDSVYEQHERDLSLVHELGLELLVCLETHCHADHVTGAWLLKHTTGCRIMASEHSGIEMLDRSLTQGSRVEFGVHALMVVETPGHTDGCISFVFDDESMVFTGDSLLIRGCGRTDFQQGSAHKLFHSIKDRLFTLPDECIVYPAHDYSGRTASSIGEEKSLNPRIGGQANENDFVGYMDNILLDHPKNLEIAVPANIKAGRPEDNQLPKQPDWAPVVIMYSGVLEISPQWVASHINEVHILDVRTVVETEEESARIDGSQMIPINELRERMDEIPLNRPIMTLCRSGKRSVLAFNILREAGCQKVATINGGLLRWNEEGLPVKPA
ncbi:MAG TPA: MBL fold metallo-hydrolase [Porticoccaceae bacterium]|jgi:glyoxylase-like metal-dependent hydrolase (beta-lactamase superfamily II)/rhodanese-related sulfurtransferase|nr:MBL fold metallo-hydrolase [Porticoccaceae bacterium]